MDAPQTRCATRRGQAGYGNTGNLATYPGESGMMTSLNKIGLEHRLVNHLRRITAQRTELQK